MIDESIMRMPRQDVSEGQEAGYIGEVEVYDRPDAGYSNAVIDVASAEARLRVAKRAAEQAEAALAAAKAAQTAQSKEAKAAPDAANKAVTARANK